MTNLPLMVCIFYLVIGESPLYFFWSALIKATQFVAGSNQGISFGALEV